MPAVNALPKVLETDRVSAQALRTLVNGDVVAIVIRGYLEKQVARDIGHRLARHPRFGFYQNANDIGRTGTAYYETIGNGELEEKYFREALAAIGDLRQGGAPLQLPIDRLRLEMDEQWPMGAQLLRDGSGRPLFVGLARIFESGAQALPHVDHLEWDAPLGRFPLRTVEQWAANIYSLMPSSGGELVIWPFCPDHDEYERLRIPGSYGLSPETLPQSPIVIKPEEGDLVIFNSHLVHAVYATTNGVRVTMSCFMVRFSAQGPLYFYS